MLTTKRSVNRRAAGPLLHGSRCSCGSWWCARYLGQGTCWGGGGVPVWTVSVIVSLDVPDTSAIALIKAQQTFQRRSVSFSQWSSALGLKDVKERRVQLSVRMSSWTRYESETSTWDELRLSNHSSEGRVCGRTGSRSWLCLKKSELTT